MALDVGPFATKAVSKIVNKDLRRQHEEGDRLAIFECIWMCNEFDRKLPKWAMCALAQAVEYDWPNGCKSFRQALFGVGPKGGPHANPLIARRDKRKQNLVNAVIDVVKEANYRGDDGYGMVKKVLERLNEHRAEDTIRSDWTHRAQHGPPPLELRVSARMELIKLLNEP